MSGQVRILHVPVVALIGPRGRPVCRQIDYTECRFLVSRLDGGACVFSSVYDLAIGPTGDPIPHARCPIHHPHGDIHCEPA